MSRPKGSQNKKTLARLAAAAVPSSPVVTMDGSSVVASQSPVSASVAVVQPLSVEDAAAIGVVLPEVKPPVGAKLGAPEVLIPPDQVRSEPKSLVVDVVPAETAITSPIASVKELREKVDVKSAAVAKGVVSSRGVDDIANGVVRKSPFGFSRAFGG